MSLTRRSALALTGAGLTAALTASTSAQASTSELPSLIEAHRRAFARFDAAVTIEGTFDGRDAERRELFVSLSIGGAQSLHASRNLQETTAGFHKAIAARYKSETHKAVAALARVSPELGAQATEGLRKAQADDLRTMRRVIREEQQRREDIGFAAFQREYEAAAEAEDDALEALLAYRCLSLDELSTKAYYVAVALKDCTWAEWQAETFLASMMQEGGAI